MRVTDMSDASIMRRDTMRRADKKREHPPQPDAK